MLRRNRTARALRNDGRRVTRIAAAGILILKDQFPYIYQCLDAPRKPSLRRPQLKL
jgi:hypothetical protein